MRAIEATQVESVVAPNLADDFGDLIGKRVGNYVIDRPLARGGMAVVFVAKHPTIGREVAIKFLNPALRGDLDVAERFIQEAKVTATLSHPNVVEILDFGELDRRPYYMMELLQGRDLRQTLRASPKFPYATVVRYLEQVCDALEAAHKVGVVHRDLKPDNIFVLQQEPLKLKVMDFGVAKAITLRSSMAPAEGRDVVGLRIAGGHTNLVVWSYRGNATVARRLGGARGTLNRDMNSSVAAAADVSQLAEIRDVQDSTGCNLELLNEALSPCRLVENLITASLSRVATVYDDATAREEPDGNHYATPVEPEGVVREEFSDDELRRSPRTHFTRVKAAPGSEFGQRFAVADVSAYLACRDLRDDRASMPWSSSKASSELVPRRRQARMVKAAPNVNARCWRGSRIACNDPGREVRRNPAASTKYRSGPNCTKVTEPARLYSRPVRTSQSGRVGRSCPGAFSDETMVRAMSRDGSGEFAHSGRSCL